MHYKEKLQTLRKEAVRQTQRAISYSLSGKGIEAWFKAPIQILKPIKETK